MRDLSVKTARGSRSDTAVPLKMLKEKSKSDENILIRGLSVEEL
jgi:hypothetical protein